MDGKELDQLKRIRQEWETDLEKEGVQERKKEFFTRSRIPVKRVYTPIDLEEAGFDYVKDLNFPGEYPYTRGIDPLMYRENLWLIGQYGGFGSPAGDKSEIQVFVKSGDHRFYHRIRSSNADGLRLRPSHVERGGG